MKIRVPRNVRLLTTKTWTEIGNEDPRRNIQRSKFTEGMYVDLIIRHVIDILKQMRKLPIRKKPPSRLQILVKSNLKKMQSTLEFHGMNFKKRTGRLGIEEIRKAIDDGFSLPTENPFSDETESYAYLRERLLIQLDELKSGMGFRKP